MNKVYTGLDVLEAQYWKKLKGHRIGLLCNQASLNRRLKPAKEVISRVLPGHLTALFGPQHGYGTEDQDNMIETEHGYDRDLAIPIYSLYSETREPLPEMLDPIDTLVIDLQDVGTRVYTYASTTLNCLKTAARAGKKIVILDRPNPLGGEVLEGNLLRPELYSFVGPFSLPMRHGLTMGEMACIFNHVFEIESDLEIVPMKGWERGMTWGETGLRWLMPSPNMPLPQTAQVYPGQVLLEGTNISEGRGTCRPFEICGAPFLDTRLLLDSLPVEAMTGCNLQEIRFQPTFHKWKGESCSGFMIHIQDPTTYRAYFTTINLIRVIMETHGEEFRWREPPYEYEYERFPIDLILGDSSLRKKIEVGEDLFEIREGWLKEHDEFMGWRGPFLLYS
jgi:uncharacterized protein YbbC (DUF1343 family)